MSTTPSHRFLSTAAAATAARKTSMAVERFMDWSVVESGFIFKVK
jgi:hypothetical protein